jgi:NADH:ubiquinone oxidoreductase subunit 6 (subunit J)
MGGLWGAVAVIAWVWPLLGALLLIVGAVFGALLAIVVALVVGFEKDSGPSWFLPLFAWWAVLPVASALLSVSVYRQRRGDDRFW